MPREANPELETRVLAAARKLWNRGGEKAVTMRAVARAAGTTTPTLYERFKDKQDILKALRMQAQQSLFTTLQPSRSPAEAWRRYLNFAMTHSREYELLFTSLGSGAWQSEPKPSFEMMKQSLAKRSGRSPEDHTDLALALWALLHGTATLLVASKADHQLCTQLRRASASVFETLVSSESPEGKHDRAKNRKPARAG
jgi:AcrR family transcriptional regulator